jgi:hypothetical protein
VVRKTKRKTTIAQFVERNLMKKKKPLTAISDKNKNS